MEGLPLATEAPESGPVRLEAVDAFRGLVMARILIGAPLIPAVAALSPGPIRDTLNRQLHHSAWHGLTWVDFSFAGYVMILGLAIALSLGPRPDGSVRRVSWIRILRRTVVLFLLGVLYNGGVREKWPDIRLAGVLQRLAVCYLIVAVIYCHFPGRVRRALIPALLLGYWGLLSLVPVPGGVAGDYSYEGNLAAWVDRQFLPGRTFYAGWDPEGILSTLPALASCLIGTVWGDLLLSRWRSTDKLLWLAVGGMLLINLGVIWDMVLPINKSLWTSSYVLATAGIGSLMLAACVLITDIWQRGWVLFPFVVIGRNVLIAYLVMGMIPLQPLALRLVGGDVAAFFGQSAPFVIAATESVLVWLLLYWLYRRRVMIRV